MTAPESRCSSTPWLLNAPRAAHSLLSPIQGKRFRNTKTRSPNTSAPNTTTKYYHNEGKSKFSQPFHINSMYLTSHPSLQTPHEIPCLSRQFLVPRQHLPCAAVTYPASMELQKPSEERKKKQSSSRICADDHCWSRKRSRSRKCVRWCVIKRHEADGYGSTGTEANLTKLGIESEPYLK
jgi:hypothetical protein